MFVAFKYKLTALISGIILLLVSGIFYMVQSNLEHKFIQGIESDLHKTRLIVHQLMAQRRRAIASSATILQGNPLIKEIITDDSLDRITADDIVAEEILIDFRKIELLLLADADGDVLSAVGVDNTGIEYLQSHPLYRLLLNGDRAVAYLFQGDRCIQVVGVPVFVREELIGVLVAGAPLTLGTVRKIKEMTGADLGFFKEGAIFLASGWGQNRDTPDFQKRLIDVAAHITPEQWAYARNTAPDAQETPARVLLNGERWLYLLLSDRRGFSPDFLLGTSLDQQLAFVDDIRNDTIIIAGVGLGLGLVLSFLFSLGVSRPIAALQHATDAVEQEDFQYRAQIKSRDEFASLANSFNLMIEGLQERDNMRGVMNRLMSKQVVDELLDGNITTTGEARELSLLWVGFKGFQAIFKDTDPKRSLALLNDCYTRCGFCIDAHNGVIDSYQNTSLLAMFGAPAASTEHRQQALQSAVNILDAVSIFNMEVLHQLAYEITVHIAFYSGELVVGNLGADNRMSYSITGEGLGCLPGLANSAHDRAAEIITDSASYQSLPVSLQAEFRRSGNFYIYAKTA